MLDASGIVHIKDNLYLIAEDEIDILKYFALDTDNNSLQATGDEITLGENESDFESLAYDSESQTIYCAGSHNSHSSKALLSFRPDGTNVNQIPFDAYRMLEDVDIESMTVWRSHLLMGYRSPSINQLAIALLYVPETGAQLMTSFDLDGRVFRDMTRINDDNYLILGGPQRGKDYKKLPSRLYWWNGDLFYPEVSKINLDLKGTRAEGVAVRLQADNSLELLIGTDESRSKGADCFRMLYVSVANLHDLISEEHSYTELAVSL